MMVAISKQDVLANQDFRFDFMKDSNPSLATIANYTISIYNDYDVIFVNLRFKVNHIESKNTSTNKRVGLIQIYLNDTSGEYIYTNIFLDHVGNNSFDAYCENALYNTSWTTGVGYLGTGLPLGTWFYVQYIFQKVGTTRSAYVKMWQFAENSSPQWINKSNVVVSDSGGAKVPKKIMPRIAIYTSLMNSNNVCLFELGHLSFRQANFGSVAWGSNFIIPGIECNQFSTTVVHSDISGSTSFPSWDRSRYGRVDYNPSYAVTTSNSFSNVHPTSSSKKPSDYILSGVQSLCLGLDNAMTVQKVNITGWGLFQPVADILNFVWNSLIAPGFEFISDSMIDSFKMVVEIIVKIFDLIYDTIVTIVKDNFNFEVVNPSVYYFDVGSKFKILVEELNDYLGVNILSAFKLRRTRIWPEGFINQFNLRIPTKFRFKFLGVNYDFSGIELLFPWIKWANALSNKVPLSEYAPYDPSVPSEYARSVNSTGLGFTFSEFAGDVFEGAFYFTLLYIASKILPVETLVKLITRLYGQVVHKPKIINVLQALGVNYDSNYEPTEASIKARVDNIQSDLSHVKSQQDSQATNTDVSDIRGDIADLSGDVYNLQSDMDHVMIQQDDQSTQADIVNVRNDISNLQADVSHIMSQQDSQATLSSVDDIRGDISDLAEGLSTIYDNVNILVSRIDITLSTRSSQSSVTDLYNAIVDKINTLYSRIDVILSSRASQSDMTSLIDEMSVVIPGKLKYNVNQILASVTDEVEGSTIANVLLLVETLDTLNNVISTWMTYMDEFTQWLQNPHAFSRPQHP